MRVRWHGCRTNCVRGRTTPRAFWPASGPGGYRLNWVLEWVVSEPKVMSLEPVSVHVAGWSDGVFLLFQIRDGRLCAWSQRVRSRAGAREGGRTIPRTHRPDPPSV